MTFPGGVVRRSNARRRFFNVALLCVGCCPYDVEGKLNPTTKEQVLLHIGFAAVRRELAPARRAPELDGHGTARPAGANGSPKRAPCGRERQEKTRSCFSLFAVARDVHYAQDDLSSYCELRSLLLEQGVKGGARIVVARLPGRGAPGWTLAAELLHRVGGERLAGIALGFAGDALKHRLAALVGA